MAHFLERHADRIVGVVSCFDRVIIQGTLPDICHPDAITAFFHGSRSRPATPGNPPKRHARECS